MNVNYDWRRVVAITLGARRVGVAAVAAISITIAVRTGFGRIAINIIIYPIAVVIMVQAIGTITTGRSARIDRSGSIITITTAAASRAIAIKISIPNPITICYCTWPKLIAKCKALWVFSHGARYKSIDNTRKPTTTITI